MRYLLDTTVVIDHARGRPNAVKLVRSLFSEPNDLYVCDAVVTESLSKGPDDEIALIDALLKPLEYVSTSPDAARWAGASRRALGRTSPRELADAIIAGVAWSIQATVVTRNPRDFEIQGVPVLAYE
ncbi:MAG: PIN domain-containing protein [Candidatus Limnocylindrales bacterium]